MALWARNLRAIPHRGILTQVSYWTRAPLKKTDPVPSERGVLLEVVMAQMRKTIIRLFPLVLLSIFVLNFCANAQLIEIVPGPSSYTDGPGHSHDQQSGCKTKSKSPCANGHLCCSLIVRNVRPLFFDSDFHFLNPAEILFHSLNATESLYRPPRSRSSNISFQA